MKKMGTFSFAAFAALSLFLACSKAEVAPSEGTVTPSVDPADNPGIPEVVTLSATLEDLTTKVGFLPVYDTDGKTTQLTTTWSEGDKIRVYNHADRTQYADFTLLPECAGQKNGSFIGTAVAGSSFDLEIVNGDISYASQTQPADGVTTDLKYLAAMSDVTDYTHVSFTEFSSVLAITCKLPSTEAAAGVKSIDFTASEAIFNSGKSLTITLTEVGDADEDGILHLFATLPMGTTNVPAGTELMVRFNAPETEHTVYSRFLTMGAATFAPNKANTLNVNAEQSDKHAGASKGEGACDGTTAAKAYLIADAYQLVSAYDLATPGATTYFKMIDDVDMDGISYTPINTSVEDYNQVVDFNGNNKTISKLSKCMFYVFKGAVYDLTLDLCSVTDRGIFAEYCQGSGHAVTNVTVSNSSVNYTGSNSGGLIGTINNGSGTTATLTDCTVSNTNVKCAGVSGGVVGFADALVVMTGCNYTGGTVESTARYCGGMLGSTGNYNSVISDCSVTDATIKASVANNDFRAGGFIGQQQTKVTIKGCTVGASDKRVNITLSAPTSGKVYNAGGFVGVSYGTITKNGDVRSKAFVTITAGNTETGKQMNLGGFAAYHSGTIEYSDADVVMTGLKGTHIGGFCGFAVTANAIIRYCTETGSVSGNNYTGGFVGVVENGSLSYCSSSGTLSGQSTIGGFAAGSADVSHSPTYTGNSSSVTVTSSGTNAGGFIGSAVGTFTSNYATGNVTATGGSIGGFAGQIWETGTASFSKNYATGNVSGGANCGGLIGYIGGNFTMSDCYATGNVGSSSKYNQKYGGLVGFTADNASKSSGIAISNCYASGNVEPSFAGAGLIGRIGLASCSVSNCAAWNTTITPHNMSAANWSSAAVVGVTFPTCTLTNLYRNPAMSLTAYWVPDADYDHPDVSATNPLTDSTGAAMSDTSTASGQAHYPQYPYHGKVEAGKTLSQLASTTLGWSSDIWDFTGDLPTLK